MPKRTRGYNSWRLEKLADPEIAAGYLNDAKQDSPEMFLKALLNVTQDRKKSRRSKRKHLQSIFRRRKSYFGYPRLCTKRAWV
jgi:hypothetical protein